MRRRVNVLVAGAGPAGMAAATAAAKYGRLKEGQTVVILDDNPALGGQIWREGGKANAGDAPRAKAVSDFHSSGAELLAGRRVVDAPEPNVLRAITQTFNGDGAEEIHVEEFEWERLVIATGARERFLPFPGWTLPGVFGAGGLQALVGGGFSVEGKRIIVAGTGPLLLAVAAHLQESGARVVCIAEQAPASQLLPFAASLWSHPGKLLQGARYRAVLARVPYRLGCWPVAAVGADSLHEVRLTDGRRTWTERCELLACGFHLVPNTELAMLLGCRSSGDFVAVDTHQQTSVENIFCAGEPTAIAGLKAALLQGEIAGLAAAGEMQRASALMKRRDVEGAFGAALDKAFRLRTELKFLAASDTIVCRCEDVTFGQLQEHDFQKDSVMNTGMDAAMNAWTNAKLQTRCGMGPCQGRICGPAVRTLFGWQSGSVRPPIFPMPVAALAGLSISNEV